MLALAIACLFASAATTYAVGSAFIADRDAFLRSKRGIWLLIILATSFVPTPPMLPSIGSSVQLASRGAGSLGAGAGALGAGGSALGASTSMIAWPSSLPPALYIAAWLVTSLGGALLGAQVWRAGQPNWRPGARTAAYDSSAGGRARGLLPMAASLDDALDTLSRVGVTARDVDTLAEELRLLGRRFSAELPTASGDAYSRVAAKVAPALAASTTRYLLEGAGRGSQIASVKRGA